MPRGYDTPLTPFQRVLYGEWRDRLPENLRGTDDYDLQGAYLGGAREAANGHLTDQWKKPNHMTFSDQSQYSTPAAPGGQWTDAGNGKWVFYASPTNIQQHAPSELADYFKAQEPGSTVVLPISYRLPPGR